MFAANSGQHAGPKCMRTGVRSGAQQEGISCAYCVISAMSASFMRASAIFHCMDAHPYIEASLGRQEFVLGSDYRRRHKGRRYWIDNAAFKNGIYLGLRSWVDVPAIDITDRV